MRARPARIMALPTYVSCRECHKVRVHERKQYYAVFLRFLRLLPLEKSSPMHEQRKRLIPLKKGDMGIDINPFYRFKRANRPSMACLLINIMAILTEGCKFALGSLHCYWERLCLVFMILDLLTWTAFVLNPPRPHYARVLRRYSRLPKQAR